MATGGMLGVLNGTEAEFEELGLGPTGCDRGVAGSIHGSNRCLECAEAHRELVPKVHMFVHLRVDDGLVVVWASIAPVAGASSRRLLAP